MVQIISRARWGARHERGFRDAPLPADEVWLHHSVTIAPDLEWLDADRDGVDDDEERAMRTLEDIGQQRFGGGISYTFAIPPSGRVYEGHGVDRQGAHTGGRNHIARAIVLVGDYSNRAPTQAQQNAVAALLWHGKTAGWWRAARLTGGHRNAPGASTACPGDRAQAAIPRINQLAASGPSEEDILAGLEDAIVDDGYRGDAIANLKTKFAGGSIEGNPVPFVESFLDDAYRTEAIAGMLPRYRGGTLKGQPVPIVTEINELHAKLDELATTVAAIKAAVTAVTTTEGN